jgi:hypothetical protein
LDPAVPSATLLAANAHPQPWPLLTNIQKGTGIRGEGHGTPTLLGLAISAAMPLDAALFSVLALLVLLEASVKLTLLLGATV